MLSILFLCTGNSARSIMAEAIANGCFGKRMRAASAGSAPKSAPHPLAIQTLARHGVATHDLRSKHWDELADEPFDLVVTLCGSAAGEPCPVFPGGPPTSHWGFPDPPAANDPVATFETVFTGIRDAIDALVADDDADLAARAARVAASATI